MTSVLFFLFSFFFGFAFFPVSSSAHAQSPTGTVRHHRVEGSDPAAAMLNQAEASIEKQDYAGAEPLLKKYLEGHSDDYAAWYYLGYAYHGMGRSDDSIAAYRKSVAARADVFESNLNLGLELAENSQPEAEQYLRAATQLKASSGAPAEGHKRAWMALGRFLAANKPDEAVNAFRQAAALDPRDSEIHLTVGELLEKQRHPVEAEKEYQEALEISPDSSDARTALTNLYMKQKQFSEAEELLKKLVAQHPSDAGPHLQLGRMLAISGKNEDAAAELEAGLKLDPADTKAQRDLADLYAEMGKFEPAQRYYSSLLNSDPSDADLHYGYGRALLRGKKFLEAQQELMKAVQLKPDFGAAYGDLAVAANENKDYQLAIKATDLRAKYLPEIPISYFLRATAYDHLRDAEQAARYYHQFLEVADGKYPEQEWQAKHRLIAIEPKK
jgi:tetratricopeptide (TPR) repeat protein